MKRPLPARDRRGSSLIELLVAIAILFLLMVGVLQIFSLSLLQNQGSAARTQLTYKCQQVVEIIRISQYLGKQSLTAYATSAGIGFPLTAGANKPLPYDSGDTNYAFWGPNGANVVEKPKDAYRLFYTVENAGAAGFRVRVTAYPADSPNLPVTVVKPTNPYIGKGSKLKVVEYVAQISN